MSAVVEVLCLVGFVAMSTLGGMWLGRRHAGWGAFCFSIAVIDLIGYAVQVTR